MSFRSPWRWRLFSGSVLIVRRLLRPLGNLEERFLDWLVQQNNLRVQRHLRGRQIASVLLIMPRCVKLSGCRVDIRADDGPAPAVGAQGPPVGATGTTFAIGTTVATRNTVPPGRTAPAGDQARPQPLAACLDCGDCPLAEVAALTRAYGVRALVAYRSHVAYAMARRERPDLIMAAACGDRLIKALRSVPEIPALLLPLVDWQRPCINATLDVQWLTGQLQRVCRPHEPVATGSSDPAPADRQPPIRSVKASPG